MPTLKNALGRLASTWWRRSTRHIPAPIQGAGAAAPAPTPAEDSLRRFIALALGDDPTLLGNPLRVANSVFYRR